jgi:hypothetical protein
MRQSNAVGLLIVIVVVVACIAGMVIQTHRLHETQAQYTNRETTLHEYNVANYYVTAELYAVTPDGVEVVVDNNGKLWEIEGLKITRHDRLLLEVRNSDTVTHVWTEAWKPPTQ